MKIVITSASEMRIEAEGTPDELAQFVGILAAPVKLTAQPLLPTESQKLYEEMFREADKLNEWMRKLDNMPFWEMNPHGPKYTIGTKPLNDFHVGDVVSPIFCAKDESGND